MKVAFFSDLHLEHREKGYGGVPEGTFHLWGPIKMPKALDADVLIIAGDTHHRVDVQDYVKKKCEDEYGIPVVLVPGNHDFYHGRFPTEVGQVIEVGGLRIASTTLWTELGPMERMICHRFSDFRFIQGTSYVTWNRLHSEQLQFLKDAKADIVATHHAPTMRSLHPRYAGFAFNPFYLNQIDIEADFDCKLWVHGHVHDPFDYMVGKTQVVCNPLGYPQENNNFIIRILDIN